MFEKTERNRSKHNRHSAECGVVRRGVVVGEGGAASRLNAKTVGGQGGEEGCYDMPI